MKQQLTVEEAAVVVGRSARTVYRWIEKGILHAHQEPDGTYSVSRTDALRIESVTKPGRPRGTARPHATRRAAPR